MTSFVSAFVAARRDRTVLPLDPAPQSLVEAFQISRGVAQELGGDVAGWKVGNAPDGTPVAAPMFAAGFQDCGTRWAMKPGLPMIPEIEIALRLAQDLPARPGKPYTRDELLEACSEALVGIEIVERRLPLQGIPFPLNLADDLGNKGYVIGAVSKDFRKLDLANLHCRFSIGDDVTTDRRGGHAKGDPMVPFLDWANAQQDLHGGLKAGQIVTLGSLNVIKIMHAPAPLAGEIEGLGTVALDVV
jgi:2-keto-4-pentenoate hydratase